MTYRNDPASEAEREPLLAIEDDQIQLSPHLPHIHQTHSPRIIVALIVFIIFFLSFASTLMELPQLRICEDIICHRYYEGLAGEGHIDLQQKIDEGLCKGDKVQNELNLVLGVKEFIGAIPPMLVAIPYGLLADKIGRKPVFVLVVTGYVLSGLSNLVILWFWRTLPLRLIWVSQLFFLIGGGDPTAGTIVYAISSDVTTDANRATVFLLGSCAGHVANLLGPAIAAALMKRSPWIPTLLGYCLLVLGSFSVLFIPETLHLHASKPSVLEPDTSSDTSDSPSREIALLYTVKSHVSVGVQKLRDSASVLTLPIVLLLLTFMSQPFANQANTLFPRYISKRFQWTLSQTGFLIALKSGMNILLLLIVLPGISHLLVNRFHYSSMGKDLSLARLSILSATIGAICIGLSPTIGLTIAGLVVTTFGVGFLSLVRSLITSLVDKEHVARLFSVIAVAETIGALVAGPFIASLFALALKLKGVWLGLPFFGLAAINFTAGLGVWFFGTLTRNAEYDTRRNSEEHLTRASDSLSLHEEGRHQLA